MTRKRLSFKLLSQVVRHGDGHKDLMDALGQHSFDLEKALLWKDSPRLMRCRFWQISLSQLTDLPARSWLASLCLRLRFLA
jgi:hypothetical protein